MNKIEPGSKRWVQIAKEVALANVPNIYACGKCNYPVINGYCCTFCNDTDPNRDSEGRNVSQDFIW